MYAVVGCRECQHLWIVADRPDTTSCPRCGHRRAFEKFRQFVTTEDEDHAREVRSSMLASRRDESEAFADLDSFAELDERVDDAVIDDEPLLERSGVDPDAVAAAGDRATETRSRSSRKETVLDAIREQDRPDRSAVIEYATARGVPESYVETALDRLARAGRVARDDGGYRLL